MKEIGLSFAPDYYESIKEILVFKDFSKEYFKQSPFTFSEDPRSTFDSLKGLGNESLIELLVSFLNKNASNSLVIIDSLTDLVRMYSDRLNWQDLLNNGDSFRISGISKIRDGASVYSL